MKKKSISASEFDKKIDEGQDIPLHLEFDKIRKPGLEQRWVTVDFPACMVQKLDNVARRLGVTRQSVIKVFFSEKLKEEIGR